MVIGNGDGPLQGDLIFLKGLKRSIDMLID